MRPSLSRPRAALAKMLSRRTHAGGGCTAIPSLPVLRRQTEASGVNAICSELPDSLAMRFNSGWAPSSSSSASSASCGRGAPSSLSGQRLGNRIGMSLTLFSTSAARASGAALTSTAGSDHASASSSGVSSVEEEVRDTVASRQHSVPLTAAAGSDIPAAADAFPPPAEVLPGTRWDRVQEAIEVMEREDRDTLYFRTKILRREEFTVEEMQEYKEVRDWATYEYSRLLGSEIRTAKLTFWTALFFYLTDPLGLWPSSAKEDNDLDEVGGVHLGDGPAWMSRAGIDYGIRRIKEQGWSYTPLAGR